MADWKFLGGITALGGLIGFFGAKTIDTKKLPAGEKAVLTGASTGATMEGLDLALSAEGFVYFYTLDEDGFGDHYDTLEEAQAAVATSSKPMEIYERREDIHEPYKMDKRMGAESFSAEGKIRLGKNQKKLLDEIKWGLNNNDGDYAIVRVKTNKYCDGYPPKTIDSLHEKGLIVYLDSKGNPDIGYPQIDLNPYQIEDCKNIFVKTTDLANNEVQY